jgi:hypothetical protein
MVMSVESQNEQIKNWLFDNVNQSITGLEALEKFGTMCLPRRILDLKETGVPVSDQFIKLPNGKRVKEYWICREDVAQYRQRKGEV